MNAKQAVAQRIMELCKSRNITINTLANDAGVPPTTIYSNIMEKYIFDESNGLWYELQRN